MDKVYDAIVIGAGPAGISASRKLREQGLDFLVLEGRYRIGGRTFTKELDGILVDLGASWIHDLKVLKDHPLHPLVKEDGVKEIDLKVDQDYLYYDSLQKGKPLKKSVVQESKKLHQKFERAAVAKSKKSSVDLTIFQAGKQFWPNIQNADPLVRRCTYTIINQSENDWCSSIEELSSFQLQKEYEEEDEQDPDFLPNGGYGKLIERSASKIKVLLNKKVVKIERKPEVVKVICRDESSFMCKKVLVSIPLGVLKAGHVLFNPPLPNSHLRSIEKLGFGLSNKVIISVEKNFWGSCEWLCINSEQRGKFSYIANISQKGKKILCAFMTNDFARKMESRPDDQIVNELLSVLKSVFNPDLIQIREAAVTRWGSEEFSLGSYSSFKAGSSAQDCATLRKPIDSQMWLIGEHCSPKFIGTVHGAWESGSSAASQAIQSLK